LVQRVRKIELDTENEKSMGEGLRQRYINIRTQKADTNKKKRCLNRFRKAKGTRDGCREGAPWTN
jgi:hypothetical protein